MGAWFCEKMAHLCSSPPNPRQTIEFWTVFLKKQWKKAYKVLPSVVHSGGVWAPQWTLNFSIWTPFALVMALCSFCIEWLWLAAEFCRHIQILFWLKILKGHEEHYRCYSRSFCSFLKNRALHRSPTGSHADPLKQRNGNKFCQNGKCCFLSQGQCLQLSWWEMMLSLIHFLFAIATLFSFVPPRNPSQNSQKSLTRTSPTTL